MSNIFTPAICGQAICGQTFCGYDPNIDYLGTKNLSFSEFGENPKLNLTTRRMLYVQPDLSIGSNSFNISVSHVYDSHVNPYLSQFTKGLPNGWKLDAQQYLIMDGKDESGNRKYKYIDGAGYIHTFIKFDSFNNRYYDIDGLGLTLYDKNIPEIYDTQENKMFFENGRLIKKVSCHNSAHNSAMEKIFQHDADGKLIKIYDSRTLVSGAPKTCLSFAYNQNGLLESVSAVNQGTVKQKIEYVYTSGKLTQVKKVAENGTNKIICDYSYNSSCGKLELMIDTVRKTAAKITYTVNEYFAKRLSSGIINSSNVFIEKTYFETFKIVAQTIDPKAICEVQIENEKGIRTSVQLNGKGRMISTFEVNKSDPSNYMTLTKDAGIAIPVAGNQLIGINGTKAEVLGLSLPSVNLTRSGDKDARYYSLNFWLNHSSTAQRLKAQLTYYMVYGQNYTSEVELDASAYEAWQHVSIPIDRQKTSNNLICMTVSLLAPSGSSVSGKVCNFHIIPSGITNYDLNSIKYEITTVNPDTGAETVSIIDVLDSQTFFTQADLYQTAYNMHKTYVRQNKTCFDITCNDGGKKIANVKILNFIINNTITRSMSLVLFNSYYSIPITSIANYMFGMYREYKSPILITTKTYLQAIFEHFYKDIENSYMTNLLVMAISPDNKSITEQYLTFDNNKIGYISLVTACTDKNGVLNHTDTIRVSSSAVFTDYKGKKLYEVDAYGVKTSYEYYSDGSRKKVTRTGTDGKYIVLSDSAADNDVEYINSAHSGYESSDFIYKQPYNIKDAETKNSYNFASNSYSPASGNVNYKYEYDAFNEAVTKVEAWANNTLHGKNIITYQNGRMATVSDGVAKYETEYDTANDEMIFSAYEGGAKYNVQKHKTVFSGITTKTDTFYRGNATDIITTKIDEYGRILQVSEGGKAANYSYNDAGGESRSASTLSDCFDPYENQIYYYDYDLDHRPIGWHRNNGSLEIKQLSSTDTKYKFGLTNDDKYLTRVVYDSHVTIEPRITGTQVYQNVNSTNDFEEIGITATKGIMSWKYEYDSLGRLEKKANRNGSSWDGRYTYTYRNNGNRTLPVIDSCLYEGTTAYLSHVTYNFDNQYNNRGMPTQIKETLEGSNYFLTGHNLVRDYTYDEFNRIKTEQITIDGAITDNNEYYYDSSGRLDYIENKVYNADRHFSYDSRGQIISAIFSGGSGSAFYSYRYQYDNYGNRTHKSFASQSLIYNYSWTRGSCLESIKTYDEDYVISYKYDRNGVRFQKKVVDDFEGTSITINYYTDGNKILGEDRSDGKKFRYCYDISGVCGFKYYDGEEWSYYTYVKNPMGSIVMIKNAMGNALVRYEYDSYGSAAKHILVGGGSSFYELATELADINPFRWKGHYYDTECEDEIESGLYYIDGRYYDPYEHIYLDAEPIENMFGNAYMVFGLDRQTPAYDNIHSLLPYMYAIFVSMGLFPDPFSEQGTTYTATGAVPWWCWLFDAIQIVAGVIMLFTPLAGFGIGIIFSGALGMLSKVFSSQLARGIGMGVAGIQSVVTGIQLIIGLFTCFNPINLILGIMGVVAGIATTAFATAEIQEGLGYGNWIKDAGMREGLYNGLMWTSYGISIFVNIVGPIANKYGAKCFAEGTLVITDKGVVPIEAIVVGTLVLAYNEETGENEYKPVVNLFRNVSEYTTSVEIKADDGTVDQIVSTPGHKYFLPDNTENREVGEVHEHAGYESLSVRWVSACNLKKGDRVLLAECDSLTGKPKYGIIISVKTEQLDEPIAVYNFEVAASQLSGRPENTNNETSIFRDSRNPLQDVTDSPDQPNKNAGGWGWKKVTKVFRNVTTAKTTLDIKADDGAIDSITSTPGHKYFLPDNTVNRDVGEVHEHAGYESLSVKWVSACNLKIGDRVLLADVNSLTGEPKYGIIAGVKTEQLDEPIAVYNIEVDTSSDSRQPENTNNETSIFRDSRNPLKDVAEPDQSKPTEKVGGWGLKKVTRVFRGTTTEWVHVDINGEAITCTGEHPFYILNAAADTPIIRFEGRNESDFVGQWVAAKDLKAGHKCLLSNGETATVQKITVEHLAEPQTTYNIEVEGGHTYCVGKNGILVHNVCETEAMRAAKQSEGIPSSQQPDSMSRVKMVGENGKVYKARLYEYGDKFVRNDFGGHLFSDGATLPRHFNAGQIVNGRYIGNGLHFWY